MRAPSSPRFAEKATTFSKAVAVAVCLLGILVLVGWVLDIGVLKSCLPGLVAMKANTALGLTLAGFALLVLAAAPPTNASTSTTKRLHRLAQACAAVVGLIGLLTLSEHLTGWDLRIDQLLFRDSAQTAATYFPGRMAPLSALNFLLVGVALLLLDDDDAPRSGFHAPEWLLSIVAFTSLLVMVGYLFGVESLVRVQDYTSMAIHTAMAFLLLSVSALCARPHRSFIARLSNEGAGGALARRLLPAAVLVPIVLAWLGLLGERAGLYSPKYGLAIQTSASVLIFCALIWVTAGVLGHADAHRKRSEHALGQAEEKYRSIFEHSADGIYQTTPGGAFITANDAMARLLGYASAAELTAELRDVASQSYVAPEGRAEFLRRMGRDDTVEGLEHEIRCKDGSRRWVSENARAVRNAEGAIQYYEGTLTDITERVLAKEAEARLAAILGATPDLVSIADAAGRLVYLNPAGRTMLGIDALVDLTRCNISEFHDVASARVVLTQGIPAALRDGVWTGDTELMAVDGHAIPVSQVILAHKAPNGTLAYLSTIARDITERASARRALQDSERLLRESQTIAGLGSYVLDIPTGRWSSSAVLDDIFGIDDQYERSIDGWASLVHPEWRERMSRYFDEEVLEKHRRFDMEYRVIRKSDGEARWVHGLGELEFDAQDKPLRMIGIISDITERRIAEAARRESERRYREVFDAGGDAILLLDDTGRFLDVNAAAVSLYGYSRSEFLALNAVDVSAEPDNTRQAIEARKKTVLSRMHRHKNGAVFPVEVAMSHYEVDGANFLVANIRDISDRLWAEKEHLRLVTAVEQAAETILIADPTGAIVYANSATARSTGYSRMELMGRNPRIFNSGKQDAEFYRGLWTTVMAGKIWTGHFINRRKDGTLYEEDATITPIVDATGAIVNFVAVKRDVTHEMQLEQQFRQAQKMEVIGRLAGGVAHDFNNLLTVIIGYSDMILEDAKDDDPHHMWAGEVRQAAEFATTLTRQLLAFSRKQVLLPRLLNLNDLIMQTTRMISRLIGADLRLVTTLAPDLGQVKADPGQIEQILLNLAVNARDAMPNGGTLTVATANVAIDQAQLDGHETVTPGNYVELTMRDSGVGMSDDVKATCSSRSSRLRSKARGRASGWRWSTAS